MKELLNDIQKYFLLKKICKHLCISILDLEYFISYNTYKNEKPNKYGSKFLNTEEVLNDRARFLNKELNSLKSKIESNLISYPKEDAIEFLKEG